MTTTVYDYEVHPLARLFPPLPPDEFKKLKNDIATHGLQDPIMLSADGRTLLDGVNRLPICKELAIEPRIVRFNCEKNPATEADYTWAKNVLRRHLAADQRAAIAHKWSDVERAAAKERQQQNLKRGDKKPERVNPPAPSRDRHPTRKAIAAKAHVTEHKIRQVETLAKTAPELLTKVEPGQLTLKDAAKIASTKTEDQKPDHRVRSGSHVFGENDLNVAIERIRGCVVEEHEKVPSEHQRSFRSLVVDRITTWAWVLNVQEDDAQEDQK